MILERTGFKCIETITPGELDIDILVNNKEHIKNRFWKTFLERANETQKLSWQTVVSESGWSSHMMVVGQKK